MTTRHSQRLYMPMPLYSGAIITPSDSQSHYLISVLRLKDGADIRLFNENDGEFLAKIAMLSRKKIELHCTDQISPPQAEPDLTLVFAPIRRQRMETMIEKATELGVTRCAPVLTDYTQTPQVNLPRLNSIATEAAEQSGRLSIPDFDEPKRLQAFCQGLDGEAMIFCDEALAGDKAAHMLAFLELRASQRPSHILIGPEGGFSDQEKRFLLDQPNIHGVSLGARILRSDTASILALGLWQASLN
ncbi:MAG: 16S rRNA (uracil(1498)-N(3))-methyltransferase [Candidatus Puniceispirillum sp. TMED52]|nr:16S rRNA (uracil(1498)-N(3))-methyltransferase [SAR116 cluster bacterium]OUU46466.1 MAG: 16S rRNA (uracil(1498)-N(3))-methyltransferase [Candidatus Puniceispirillum sp. TMED52]